MKSFRDGRPLKYAFLTSMKLSFNDLPPRERSVANCDNNILFDSKGGVAAKKVVSSLVFISWATSRALTSGLDGSFLLQMTHLHEMILASGSLLAVSRGTPYPHTIIKLL